jgi:hypothetical protein
VINKKWLAAVIAMSISGTYYLLSKWENAEIHTTVNGFYRGFVALTSIMCCGSEKAKRSFIAPLTMAISAN